VRDGLAILVFDEEVARRWRKQRGPEGEDGYTLHAHGKRCGPQLRQRLEQDGPQDAQVHCQEGQLRDNIKLQHLAATNEIDGVADRKQRRDDVAPVLGARGQADNQDEYGCDAAKDQNHFIAREPDAQTKFPEVTVDIKDAALPTMKLPPDGVEQGNVFLLWFVEIKVQVVRQEFVFQGGIEEIEGDHGAGHIGPESQGETIILLLTHLMIEQIEDNWSEEDSVLFCQDANTKGKAAHHDGQHPAIVARDQIEAEQQPEHHDVIQKHLALIVDGQRREVEEETG